MVGLRRVASGINRDRRASIGGARPTCPDLPNPQSPSEIAPAPVGAGSSLMAVARVRFSPAKPGTGLLRASTGPAFRDGIPPDLSPGDTAPLMGAGVTRR